MQLDKKLIELVEELRPQAKTMHDHMRLAMVLCVGQSVAIASELWLYATCVEGGEYVARIAASRLTEFIMCPVGSVRQTARDGLYAMIGSKRTEVSEAAMTAVARLTQRGLLPELRSPKKHN